MNDPLNVYDSDILAMEKIIQELHDRYQGKMRNYAAFEREAREKFAAIGLDVAITWNEYAIGGTRQEGAMPEITVTGRIEPEKWDPDRMVHEVTSNILEIPGAGGVIKTDESGVFKQFREDSGHDHGHGHGHSH